MPGLIRDRYTTDGKLASFNFQWGDFRTESGGMHAQQLGRATGAPAALLKCFHHTSPLEFELRQSASGGSIDPANHEIVTGISTVLSDALD